MTKKTKLNRINSILKDEYDIFICSASFESRCLSIPKKFRRKSFDKVLIIENASGSDLLSKNADALTSFFKPNTERIRVNLSDPLDIADKIINSIKFSSKKINILIDITTFTHEVLLICLKYLNCLKRIKSVTCVYVNADSYCPNFQINQKWLSEGSKGVHSILGYPGMLLPSQKTHLVVVVGYEYNRAFSVISAIEPSSITLVYGSDDSTTTEKDKGANQHYKKLLENMAFEYSNIESIEIPCNDPDASADRLSLLFERHADKNIIVVPMNNKMTTLGLFLSVAQNEFVQICYSQALVYNENNYSEPGETCYIYKIQK